MGGMDDWTRGMDRDGCMDRRMERETGETNGQIEGLRSGREKGWRGDQEVGGRTDGQRIDRRRDGRTRTKRRTNGCIKGWTGRWLG